ncbi:MAG: DUF4105 domain-containing protein [Alphaproteobacteria bacterium]|nr:DUF4105 domain-containing protein [Alphaproteobacteria bacterium]MCB9796855.1 DUF4105 domain-containing protein [Alphaproteobacteria bacterium]
METTQQEGPIVLALTMTPGAELYSRFGHTAVWVIEEDYDPRVVTGTVYNFGVFLPSPGMLIDWLRGQQTYWMGSTSIRNEVRMYQYLGRGLYAQRLDMPPEAAREFLERLKWFERPENREYNYQWLLDNCSTRIRDLLDEVLDGQLEPQHELLMGVSPRTEVLRHVWADPALSTALQFAFGPRADRELNRWETMFLPDRLYLGLEESEITWPDGVTRPLVAAECEITPPMHPMPKPEPPDRSGTWWGSGLGLALGFAGLGEAGRRVRPARWLLGLSVMAFGALIAAVGSAVAILWAISPLSSSWDNINLALANPLSWALLGVGFGLVRGLRGERAFKVAAGLAAIAWVGGLIGLTGVTGQDTSGLLGLIGLPLAAIAGVCWRLKPEAG